jgi:hypothetical protein
MPPSIGGTRMRSCRCLISLACTSRFVFCRRWVVKGRWVIWIGRWGVARKFTGEVLEEEEGRRCWEMGRRRSSWLKHESLSFGNDSQNKNPRLEVD